MRRYGGRARWWPAGAIAAVGVLMATSAGPAWASTTPAPTAPGTPDVAGSVVVAALPAAAVHDDPACQGPVSATVTGTFSVSVADLVGGPLAAVTVRSDTLVVASAVAVLGAQGSGCADFSEIAAGSYQVTASIGDMNATASVVVPAPVAPVAPPATTDPAPAPVPDPTVAPPVDTVAPSEPAAPTDAPAPDPATPAPTHETPPAAADPGPPAPSPAVSVVVVDPAGARAADTGRAARVHQVTGATASASATVPAAPPAEPTVAPTATTAVTAVLDSTRRATRKVVSVLVSSDRPPAVTIIGFVVLEVLGVALLVAFVVLVVSRAPRRRD